MITVVPRTEGGVLTCVFWDVQHGHATYIGTPAGEHVVIDAGSGSVGTGGANFSPLQWLMNRWGVQRLDAAIITHPHRDHISDLGNLMRLSPRILQRPKLGRQAVLAGNRTGRNLVDSYETWETGFDQPVTWPNSINCNQDDGYSAQTFVPTRCPESNLNNRSVVTVVSYARTKLLIPGDNERIPWLELLQRDDFITAIAGTNILLAPHHGRQAGFCEELFEVIRPSLTVISDGPSGNTSATQSYRTRTEGWVCARRSGRGAIERKVLSTRRDGAVALRCYWRAQRPYLDVTVN